jgi:hypothetical protein
MRTKRITDCPVGKILQLFQYRKIDNASCRRTAFYDIIPICSKIKNKLLITSVDPETKSYIKKPLKAATPMDDAQQYEPCSKSN